LWGDVAHRSRRNQRSPRRGDEFVLPSEESRADLTDRSASTRQGIRARRDMATRAGRFVEMDPEPCCRRLDLLECAPRLDESVWRDQFVLCFETLRGLLRPSIRGQYCQNESMKRDDTHLGSPCACSLCLNPRPSESPG